MHLVFYRTTDVFAAEEILRDHNISTEIVPTPVQNMAYCGVCVCVSDAFADSTRAALKEFEYKELL